MTTWTLILYVAIGTSINGDLRPGGTLTSINGFSSEKICENAKSKWLNSKASSIIGTSNQSNIIDDDNWLYIKGACVRKN